MSMCKDYAARLPGGYAKGPLSANSRLLSLPGEALAAAEVDLAAVDASAGLDGAAGQTLDFFGQSVGLSRGALDDTQYRFLIKARVARCFVGGDHTGVLTALAGMFGIKENELSLGEEPRVPATVRVYTLPFGVLQQVGFTGAQAVRIIKELLPVGVRLVADNFEGTFAFANTDDEYDETTGFSDAENAAEQTMGGFLGFVPGDETAPPLPL